LRKVVDHVRSQWLGALALFLVIAGGTAYAANMVGSSGVIDDSLKSVDIKGHLANATGPAEDGTITGADVKDGGLGSADIANDSLGGAKIDESTLSTVPAAANGGLAIDWQHSYPQAPVAILSHKEMTVTAACQDPTSTVGFRQVNVAVASSIDADVSWNWAYQSDSGGNPTVNVGGDVIPANGSRTVASVGRLDNSGAGPPYVGYGRGVGQLIYHNANRVIVVTFHAVADLTSDSCHVQGVAVSAPG